MKESVSEIIEYELHTITGNKISYYTTELSVRFYANGSIKIYAPDRIPYDVFQKIANDSRAILNQNFVKK